MKEVALQFGMWSTNLAEVKNVCARVLMFTEARMKWDREQQGFIGPACVSNDSLEARIESFSYSIPGAREGLENWWDSQGR